MDFVGAKIVPTATRIVNSKYENIAIVLLKGDHNRDNSNVLGLLILLYVDVLVCTTLCFAKD
jgi:hypothetical protein